MIRCIRLKPRAGIPLCHFALGTTGRPVRSWVAALVSISMPTAGRWSRPATSSKLYPDRRRATESSTDSGDIWTRPTCRGETLGRRRRGRRWHRQRPTALPRPRRRGGVYRLLDIASGIEGDSDVATRRGGRRPPAAATTPSAPSYPPGRGRPPGAPTTTTPRSIDLAGGLSLPAIRRNRSLRIPLETSRSHNSE